MHTNVEQVSSRQHETKAGELEERFTDAEMVRYDSLFCSSWYVCAWRNHQPHPHSFLYGDKFVYQVVVFMRCALQDATKINLAKFMNPAPFSIQEACPTSRVYR